MIDLINDENADAFRELRGKQFLAIWAFKALRLAVKRVKFARKIKRKKACTIIQRLRLHVHSVVQKDGEKIKLHKLKSKKRM